MSFCYQIDSAWRGLASLRILWFSQIMTFRGITVQRALRFTARMVRSHAPGVFHRVAANRVLRAVYRRIATPKVTSPVAYVSPPVSDVVETMAASASLANYLKIEMANWKPGKRIDA